MRRVQTFVVTVDMPSKDSCGTDTPKITEGDIRRALSAKLPIEGAEISVDERGEEK